MLAWLPERCWHVVNRDDDNSHAEEPVDASGDVLEATTRNPDRLARYRAARAADSPPKLLTALAQDGSPGIRRVVAANPATPPTALERLAHDIMEPVRTAVAANPAAPPAALELLAHDKSETVRSAVVEDPEARASKQAAANPHTAPATLATLASDPDEAVRWLAAGNPGTPPDALAALAEDADAATRRLAAVNPGTPPDALAALAQDADGEIRRLATQALRTSPDALTVQASDPDVAVRRLAAGNPGTPPEVLAVLSQDPDEQVRISVAGNPARPPRVLESLAQDESESVRTAVARDPECPPEVLLSLAQNPDTHDALLENPNTPGEALQLISRGDFKDKWNYYQLALHPNTPTDVLRSLTGEPFSWVICKNPAAPLELRLWAFEHGRFEEDSGVPFWWSWQIEGCEKWPEPLLKKLLDQEDWPPSALWSSSHLSAGFIRYMAERCLSQGSWADDYEGDCKRACLENPATPPDVIDQLAADPDPIVRLIVGSVMLRRPEFSDERAEALMRSCVHDAMTEEPEEYTWDDSGKVVDDILSDPNCPASVRAEVSDQSSAH
ncbi:MAG: hypothetical protein KDC39_11945 [Actinobacteria bacterium]|nr:hypothetical protein [Actinomycetota bacterium]